jgi:hypothetical protein
LRSSTTERPTSRETIRYGPPETYTSMPFASIGMSGFTAAKNGIEIWAMNVGSAWSSLMVSFCPLATTPETPFAFFSLNAWQPATLFANATAGEPWSGWQARKIERANAAAVMFEPSLNLRPGFTVNV